MAQQGFQLDHEKLCCSICLDLLKDPVTIPCGHNYCMNCIKTHWNEEDKKKIHSCPQCRLTFTPRPILVKNTMLADLVEDLEKTGLQAAPADHCYAGPEDVACDVCTGRKLKALKSCLACLASYCEKHLQPHYDAAPLKKHKLVDPSKRLQENICSRHDELMKMFCRTDQQCICYLCSVDEHKGHDTVSAAAERTERQKELEVSRQNIQQRIHGSKKVMKELQQEVEAINRSANKVVKESEKIFTELIRFIQERSSDVKQQVRSQQKTEVSRVRELQDKLQQEITELKRKDAELMKLSHAEDHNQFLQNYSLHSCLTESIELPGTKTRPLEYFEDVTSAVAEVRDELQNSLSKKLPKILRTVTEVDAFLSQQMRAREEFLLYACPVTLNPNTAHPGMVLSQRRRKVTTIGSFLPHFYGSRFSNTFQVLSCESLTGRCYWEVTWDALVTIAVAYKDISRVGSYDECAFGHNDKSWAIYCVLGSKFEFRHNNVSTPLSCKSCNKIGVFLDHKAGILSFHNVEDKMKLLHRVQTTFTQPLYAGLALHYSGGDNAELCELK